MDKQSENVLREVICELNEKKEPGMQILAEQALQEKCATVAKMRYSYKQINHQQVDSAEE